MPPSGITRYCPSEPRFPHRADVEIVQRFVIRAVHASGAVVIHFAAGDVEAQHRAEEVVAFFSRKRVAKYKYPEHIVVIEKLPRTASGKIQKFLLRKDIMRRLTQDVCEEIE